MSIHYLRFITTVQMVSTGYGGQPYVFGLPGSIFGNSRAVAASPPSSSWPSDEETQRLTLELSSSDMDSPPLIFNQPPLRSMGGGLLSDHSANAGGLEDV